MRIDLNPGDLCDPHHIARRLVSLQYDRNDSVLERGTFRIRGDVIEIYPAYLKDALRVELGFNEIESIKRINPLTGGVTENIESVSVYPAKHFVLPEESVRKALDRIRDELRKGNRCWSPEACRAPASAQEQITTRRCLKRWATVRA